VSQRVEPAGISALELTRTAVADVGMRYADAITPAKLAEWLVGQQLAVRRPDGRLEATRLGASIGGSFRPLEGA
jgi:hypothetical protein